MKKILLLFYLLIMGILSGTLVFSQDVNITSWNINQTGHQAQYYNSSFAIIQMTDSSDVQEVCYNTDTIYVRASGLASFIMGPWPGDPFTASAHDHSYIFPRNPVYPSTIHTSLPTGVCGMLTNGVLIYTAGDGKSYKSSTNTNSNNGDGNWNSIAWEAHGGEMDANGGAHPDVSGNYHNHSNPYGLYDSTDKTNHSPIIGWAFDGFPIYGPYGYSSATDAGSGIKRMEVSYQLRTITDRSSTSPAGPSLAAYALGYYIEDYEYVASSGDLDEYNGRYCITPEYPGGIYAYFLGTNADGSPTYPNILAKKFYGKNAIVSNFGASGGSASKPTTGVTCVSTSTSPIVTLSTGTSSISETSGSTTVTATLSATSSQTVTVNLSLSGTATTTTDYTLLTSITITAGNTTGSITLNSVADTKDENDETVIIDISSVTNGSESGTQQQTITITDDDAAPTVTLSTGATSISETNSSTTVTATLSATSGLDVTVNLSLSGTATVTSDYTLPTAITITAGNTSAFVTASSIDDLADEGDETIQIDILSVTNGSESGTQQKTITIIDNLINGILKRTTSEASVYPNPSAGIFHIDLQEPVNEITILDDKGIEVKKIVNPELENTIDLNEFANGLYIIRVVSKNVAVNKIKLQK